MSVFFESLFESKLKCKYVKISTLTVKLVPRLFARYMFQLHCKVTHFLQKRAECASFL